MRKKGAESEVVKLFSIVLLKRKDGTPKLPKRKKAVEHEGEARTA